MKKSTVVPLCYLLTKSRIASELGIDRKRVAKLLARVPPDGRVDDRYDGWYLSTACPVVYGLVGFDESEVERDPELMQPKDRKDWYDGEQRRVALEKDVGNLIPSDVHRRELALVISQIVNEFEALPDILERDCGAPPEMVIKASEAVDRVRKQAHERIIKLPDE